MEKEENKPEEIQELAKEDRKEEIEQDIANKKISDDEIEEKQEELKPEEEKTLQDNQKEIVQEYKTEENEKEEPEEIDKKVEQEVIKTAEEKTEERISDQKEKVRKNRKRWGIIIASSVIILVVMLFSVIFALFNMNNNKILNGISVFGIDVSNLSIEEATKRIDDAIEAKFSNENEDIILRHKQAEVSVDANSFNAKFDVDAAIAEAYSIGRSGNIITNNYNILWTKFFKKEIQPKLSLDGELLSNTISDINSKLEDAVVEYSYYIEDGNLIIVKGKAGYIIKEEELKSKIYEQINNIHNPYQEIEIPVEYKEPAPINLEKIRNEIYKEPKDAYIEKNPTTVHVEVNGVDFKISMEQAQKLLQEDKKEYTIPLKITVPKKTLKNLGEEAFPDQLATFSTIYDASNTNRSHNIELASKKINGTIIMPGETFSYNTTTGKRTIEAGFKEGTAYIGGKVVPDVGGGVCQLSSTLYNVALLANLEIKERSNHIFLTGYVDPSRDATVYYGSLDLVFKNTRTYPVKIIATSKNGVCKVSIYGIKEKTEYQVIIQSKVTSYINYKTTYKMDSTLEEGKEVVEQYGHNGCRSEGYRILKLNGKVVSQTLLSKDTYSPMERIVRKGTKKVNKPVNNNTEKSDKNTTE